MSSNRFSCWEGKIFGKIMKTEVKGTALKGNVQDMGNCFMRGPRQLNALKVWEWGPKTYKPALGRAQGSHDSSLGQSLWSMALSMGEGPRVRTSKPATTTSQIWLLCKHRRSPAMTELLAKEHRWASMWYLNAHVNRKILVVIGPEVIKSRDCFVSCSLT